MVKTEPGAAAKPKSSKASAKIASKLIPVEDHATVAIDAFYAGDAPEASVLPKNDGFGLELRVHSSRAFTATSTLAITEGKYAGYSAILFKPASAFRYMDLPMEIRDRIQKMVLLPAEPVQIKNKSNARQQLTAVGYTAKNRLALLGVDKQIRAETFPLVYSKIAFSADSSNTLTKFLLGIGVNARSYLRDLSITNYAKKDIQMLFVLLADCTNISRLHIAKYPTGGTPAKIARAFSIDAGSWLSSRVTKSGKGLAIKPVRFGPRALMNGTKPFTDKDVALFFEELEKKI